MTKAQATLRKLQAKQSRQRQKMGELAQVDTLTDEQRSELDEIEADVPDTERKIRAAQVALEDEEAEAEAKAKEPGNVDPETRERLELRSKASLLSYMQAALSGRQVNGAELELSQAAGVNGIPLELWDLPEARTEQRADLPTGAPGTVGVNLDVIRPAVFANSIAPRLGIEMPRVESGTYASATITTSLTAASKAKGAAADSTAAAFTVSSVTPKRISARLGIRIEDVAAVGQQNFESILRENLALVLSDALDNQAINGDGSGTDLVGIFQGLTDPNDPADVSDFDAFAAVHAGGVDGLWANSIKEVSVVVGPDTYQLGSRTFQTAQSYKGELSAAAYAMQHTGGFWTNERMPAAAGDIQQGILYRAGRSMRTAVCPHWNEISIDDIYSGSAQGERFFTMHVLLGDVILVQPKAYSQVAFKVA